MKIALTIGDTKPLFDQLGISEPQLLETLNYPNKSDFLNHGICLFAKIFKGLQGKREVLLLATRVRNGLHGFHFAFWISLEMYSEKFPLLDLLILFTHRFGVEQQIGAEKGLFIMQATKILEVDDTNYWNHIKTLVHPSVPIQFYAITNEVKRVGSIKWLDYYYVFTINTNKYLFWLDDHPTVPISLARGWHEYFKQNLLEWLNPNGQTQIRIFKQTINDHLKDDLNRELAPLEVPKIYSEPIKYAADQVNALKNNEGIIFGLQLESKRCVFCGSSEASKEHIFPKWLRNYTKDREFSASVFMGHDAIDVDLLSQQYTLGKKETLFGHTTKCICRKCNGTWLSRLEEKTKSILIRDNRIIDKIPPDITHLHATTIIRWAIIKILLLQFRGGGFGNEHIHVNLAMLKDGIIPEGFIVEFKGSVINQLNYVTGVGLYSEPFNLSKRVPKDRAKDLSKELFTGCLQVSNLIFRVSFLPNDSPFKRIAGLKSELTLHPLNMHIENKSYPSENKFWIDLEEQGLHLVMFRHMMLLDDK